MFSIYIYYLTFFYKKNISISLDISHTTLSSHHYELMNSVFTCQLLSFFLMSNLSQASFCIFLFNEPINLCARTCFLTWDFSGLPCKFPALGLEIPIFLRSTLMVNGNQKSRSRCQLYSMLLKWICLKPFQQTELENMLVFPSYLSINLFIYLYVYTYIWWTHIHTFHWNQPYNVSLI